MGYKFFPKTILLFLALCTACHSFADDTDTLKHKYSRHEITISEGIITYDQVRAFFVGELRDYMSMPYSLTGGLFVSYRYSLLDWCSVGGTFGIDNQQGNLTYGPVQGQYMTGTTGVYKRNVSTIACEFRYVYKTMDYGDNQGEIYGTAGLGYTVAT